MALAYALHILYYGLKAVSCCNFLSIFWLRMLKLGFIVSALTRYIFGNVSYLAAAYR